ncbi:EAL domain-containing protein [Bacillus salipaludis]|uniref:EAL domain-containing protein n=1 Tax=Bacillus salipaludis TaxID=2547811 RepID=A0ABW8RD55_9BACI
MKQILFFKIYKSLFDYHHDACFSLDLEGNFILFNDAAVKLTGYSKEEAHQMSFIPLLLDDCKEDVFRYFDNVLQGNQESFKTIIQNKQGKKVEVSLSVFPLYIKKQVVGVGCTAEDMTEINNLNLLLTAAYERIDFLSFHDEPTGLANKTLFAIRQFYQPNLVSMIDQIIKETNVEPNCLTIEITESMTMDVEKASIILNDLKNIGVYITIDDFGTGYSSLSYLKKFPIDNLKIDRSFIGDIAKSKDDENIATMILLIADNLGLSVIAEGVETSEQLGVLRQHRCNEAQGFLFSKPLAEDDMKEFLSNLP